MQNILRRKEVANRLHISQTTLWRWVRSGHFPGPINYGPNTRGYFEADVENWLQTKKLASNGVV
jgi:prophage regulatory protein